MLKFSVAYLLNDPYQGIEIKRIFRLPSPNARFNQTPKVNAKNASHTTKNHANFGVENNLRKKAKLSKCYHFIALSNGVVSFNKAGFSELFKLQNYSNFQNRIVRF